MRVIISTSCEDNSENTQDAMHTANPQTVAPSPLSLPGPLSGLWKEHAPPSARERHCLDSKLPSLGYLGCSHTPGHCARQCNWGQVPGQKVPAPRMTPCPEQHTPFNFLIITMLISSPGGLLWDVVSLGESVRQAGLVIFFGVISMKLITTK